MTRSPFSVVIPTLQRSVELPELLGLLCSHPLVGEVIVVNNAPAPIEVSHPKINVLNQDQNIFVNPAWNLGVSHAQFENLIIANDDIRFPQELLDRAAIWMSKRFGVIGPADAAFQQTGRGKVRLRPAYRRSYGFGTLMMMRTASYVPIPDDLRIWSGDTWLFHQQVCRNYVFEGVRICTPMSTTMDSEVSFSSIGRQDADRYVSVYKVLERYPRGRFRAEALAWRTASGVRRRLGKVLNRR